LSEKESPEVSDGAVLRERIGQLAWYHTFDLPDGVVTPGTYDHRRVAAKVAFPPLSGLRCLDVASSDGFWAVEMAKRGAAEVVSMDLADMTKLDWQGVPSAVDRSPGTGRAAEAFAIVTQALGLDIDRRDLSVYDLSPAEVGTFDFVFMGNVLLHLSDPGRALRAVRSVTRGRFFSYEMIQLLLSLMRPRTPLGQLWHLDDARWWTPNLAGHRRLVEAGGFTIERAGGPLLQPFGDGLAAWPRNRADLGPFGLGAQLSYWLFLRRFGAPTSWVLARPTGG